MSRHLPTLALASLVAILPGMASAHQIWLEREGSTARAYFGEPVENLREPRGGLLDRIASPRVFLGEGGQPLTLRRTENAIEATLPAGTGDVRLVEEGLGTHGQAETGRTKPVLLAREGRSETRPAMELELVPEAAGGNRFTLMFRGQPLPRAEVTLVAPPRWERRMRTDAEGRVSFETPWAGRYVAEAVHIENAPGGDGDGAYARRRLVSTVSFTVAQGIAWTGR
ncbi:DUF4198 domain-containing protein [Sabulicella rubraurantiaca]|uniref:DUF4198 domain-containing protein n=1 Tax=Sabulicella rubraurantiaca TaxID=2811429 RepID=UPI001A962854|nr:DUF4198 domain-containing protein [Sabulicella rubraurantiaca]